MSYDLEPRYVYRYGKAVEIHQKAVDDISEVIRTQPDLIDLSARLLITPTIIWDQLFQLGMDPNTFWDRSLDAYKLATKWGFTLGHLSSLVDACEPDKRTRTEIDLNEVLYPQHATFNIIFGHLGERAQEASKQIPDLSADLILPYLADPSDEFPPARYELGELKGKGRFRFDNLAGGGVRYFLPTILDSVQARLTYSHTAGRPVVSIIVNPITSS